MSEAKESGVAKKRKTIRLSKDSGMKKAIEAVSKKKKMPVNTYIQKALVDAVDDPMFFRM